MNNECFHALSPDEATRRIREIASTAYKFSMTKSSEHRMQELDQTTVDLHHVFINGEVVQQAIPSSCAGYYKYIIECGTPNFIGKIIRLVVIPSSERKENQIKVCEIII